MADKTNIHKMRSNPFEGMVEGRSSVTMLHTEGKSRRDDLTRGWELREEVKCQKVDKKAKRPQDIDGALRNIDCMDME
jgi:hypothetical protein